MRRLIAYMPSEDMLYSGTVPGSGTLEWAATSMENGRVYVLRESTGTELEMFETGFLIGQGSWRWRASSRPADP